MAELLRIEEGGIATLEGVSPERVGRWTLLSGPAELLFGVRSVPGGASPGRVVLAGLVEAVPLPDVFTLISQARLTATLRLSGRKGQRSLVFVEGEVRGASSSHAGDRLGEILVHEGRLTPAQLAPLLGAPGPNRRLGRLLVERGLLTEPELWAAIRRQVSLVVQGMLLEREASWLLTQGGEEPLLTPGLPTQGLLLDGIRQLDELGLLREPIPEDATVRATQAREAKLSPDQRELLRRVTRGAASPTKLAEELGRSPVELLRDLRHLSEAGLVSITHEAAPPAFTEVRPPQSIPPIVRVFNQIFREILAEAARHGRAQEARVALSAALAEPSRSALFHGVPQHEDGTLHELHLLGRLAPAAQAAGAPPADHLLEVLQQVMFALLFAVGEQLPRATNEGLTRRVRVLFGTLEE